MRADGLEDTRVSEVEAIEIRLFLEALHARYGYDLREYAPGSMTRRVRATLVKSGFRHLGELQHAVLHDPLLFARVIDHLTVQVTEMFRDPSFYRELRAQVLPVLRTYPLLKTWHTGCSTGEEVYSFAIMLHEEGLYERSQIYATDLSTAVLEQAKRGIYPAERMQAFADNYGASGGTGDLSAYATEAYGHVSFRDELRENVLFFQHDLVTDYVFGEMNVIFCRNVVMYFGEELRQRVVDKLTESLAPGGFLCLGSAERISKSHHRELTELGEVSSDVRIYRRTSQRRTS